MKFTDLGDNGPDFIREMDSQGYTGSRDKKSSSKYGSRDDYELGKGKEHTAKPTTADKMMKDAHDAMMRAMSQEDKVKKGWAHPDTLKKKGVAEGSLEEYGDTAKGQKMLTKVQKRAVDRVVSKKADTDPKYAKKNKDTADRAWERMSGVAEASLAQMRDYFSKDDSDSVQVNRNYDAPSKKQNPLGIPPEIQALVNKMYHAGKISPQEFEVLRKFQQKTKINVGIREADKNPYAIGMAQAMKSTGDKPPLKKSTINKAHKIARAIEKDE